MSVLYLMYLRISELTTTSRWKPQMGYFYQDSQENWWFKTVGKGNKERDITVSEAMLGALARYRHHPGLTPTLPLPGESTPLIHKLIGQGGDDLNKHGRPTVHVRDDAGHTTSATTDLYNNAELQNNE